MSRALQEMSKQPWDMKREKTSILYTNIGIKDYRKLRKVAKKTKSHIKI